VKIRKSARSYSGLFGRDSNLVVTTLPQSPACSESFTLVIRESTNVGSESSLLALFSCLFVISSIIYCHLL
jgi:hypothetical protein